MYVQSVGLAKEQRKQELTYFLNESRKEGKEMNCDCDDDENDV